MKKNKKIITYSILITFINSISFFFCWVFLSEEGSLYKAIFITYRLLFLTYLICFMFFCDIFDSFAFDRRKISENAYSTSLSSLISMLFFYFLNTLAFREFYSPLYLLAALFISVLENVILSRLANKSIFKNYVLKRATVFYKNDEDLNNIKKLVYFDYKYKIDKKIKNPTSPTIDLNSDVVFVSGINTLIRDEIIKQCLENKKEIFIFPNVGDIVVAGGKYVEEHSMPMLKINLSNTNFFYECTKRIYDIVVSSIAIIILSPFMMLTAIIIKLFDKGPVLYKQTRLTKAGKQFTIYKFRSMRVDAEKDGVARVSSKNDDRITPIGKIIRAIRFDELPQLFNILKGEMSIVGPRPERPEIAKQYEKKYPSFRLRLQVKAGLTGYAQIYGKYNSDPSDKLKMDLFYINNRSFLYDIKLCFMTIKILFMKESTEAIDEGKTTAAE